MIFEMSSKNYLSGRLERIRTSRNTKNVSVADHRSGTPLNSSWKQITPYVSLRQVILKSPFISFKPESGVPLLFSEIKNSSIENFIFYDLETTGLSGGAGTVAFLAGFGWIKNGNLIINQYFLHDFPGEIDFLLYINKLLVPGKILVSYNGKSFDHPLLRSRFLMKGLVLNELQEIDLLHTSRRLWKNRLPSCRLSSIENNILDIHRIDDIPGIEVPDIYFNFLKNNLPEPLEGVFKHHLQDIKSLVVLLAYMEQLWANPLSVQEKDRTAMGKLLVLKERKEGEVLLRDSWKHKDYEAGKFLSIHYKRKGNISAAADIWKVMWQDNQELFQGLELAKYYEHKLKEIESALNIVNCLLLNKTIMDNSKVLKALEHRLKRLERKHNFC
jgi:uncharacterized protein